VSNAERPPRLAGPKKLLETGELPLLLDAHKGRVRLDDQGDPAGIIAAVFKAFETPDEKGDGLGSSDITDDAAHFGYSTNSPSFSKHQDGSYAGR
jgi:hypothetical protein